MEEIDSEVQSVATLYAETMARFRAVKSDYDLVEKELSAAAEILAVVLSSQMDVGTECAIRTKHGSWVVARRNTNNPYFPQRSYDFNFDAVGPELEVEPCV